jgi:beta-glucanase (GH16 family)
VSLPHHCRYTGQYPNVSAGQPPIDYSLEYHTFAVEWDSYQISWFVDDVFYVQRYQNDPNGAEIPQTPFYIILNTAISWWTEPPTDAITEVLHIIDYVRVYKNVTAGAGPSESSDTTDTSLQKLGSAAEEIPALGERKVVRDTVWELTWQDEFNGTALNTSNWTPGQNFNDSLLDD